MDSKFIVDGANETSLPRTPSECVLDEPHALVRWVIRDGKQILQQAWKTTTYIDAVPAAQTMEWRDVLIETEEPVATEPAKPTLKVVK